MARYQVVVGNIGTVYAGRDEAKAWNLHNDYVIASLAPHGRASGETVRLLCDDDMICEFIGSVDGEG